MKSIPAKTLVDMNTGVGEYTEPHISLRDTYAKFCLLLALWVIAFLPVHPGMIETWLNHSDNSHGLLVPFISLYFLWRKKDELRQTAISQSNWGALILVASLLIYLIAYAGGIAFVSRCMIVFSLAGLVLCCLGREYFKKVSFPVLFLLLMIPIPDSILNLVAFPLQLFVTKASTLALQFFAIPAYREGNMVYFAETQLEVAEACSGIRSLASLGMLSILFAHLTRKGWLRKLSLLLMAVPLALFINLLRVVGTGILAHFYGGNIARGFLHDFSGVVVFILGLMILSLLYAALNKSGQIDHA